MIINLPKLGPVNFSDSLTPEQFQSELSRLQEKYDFKLPKPEVGIGTLLKRGFMRGMGETGIALGDTLPAMAGSALGFDDYAQRQMGEAQESRAALEAKYPTQFKSYTEIGSPYEALQYGAETLGELGPTALTAMIPGVGAGALGSRLAARGAMGAALEAGPLSMAGRAAAETAAKQAGQVAGKRAMYGGVYLGSFAQNAPEVFESIYRETDKMEPGIAALAGGLSSVLDAIVPGKLLGELGGYGKMKVIEKVAKDSGAAPKVWKYIAKEAATTAASEGLTEAAQETINAAAEQVAGSTKEMFGPENIQRFKESFVKGAIGGGAFGTVGGTSQGFTAKKEFANLQKEFATAKEAEAYVNQLRAQEEAAGTLTPEKAAEYDAQIANDRAQREAGLTAAFAQMPEDVGAVSIAALMERADNIKEFNPGAYERIYGDIDAAIAANKAKIAEDETKAKAQAQAELNKVEAEYDKGLRNKQAGSAFATRQPTSGTGGMFKPALEQQRADQQAATRQFAFGDAPIAAADMPGDPVTVDTLKNLKVSDRSEVGLSLLGADLDTVDGRRKLIQTLEKPSFTGKIDEDAYDALVSTFDQQEVKAARAEMQTEELSPTKQKQQAQTRAFAFGDPNATRPDTSTNRGSTGVVSEPVPDAATGTDEATQRGGDVSTQQDAGGTAVREGQQPATLTSVGKVGQVSANAPAANASGKVSSMVERRQEQLDNAEDQQDEIEYAQDAENARTAIKEKYDRQVKSLWPVIERAKKVLRETKYPNSLEASAVDFHVRQLEGFANQYNDVVEGDNFNSPRDRLDERAATISTDLEALQANINSLNAPPQTRKGKKTTDGTTTTEAQQAEPQEQKAATAPAAVAPTRGTSMRPDLSGETPVVNAKLGQRGVKLDAQSKDARAYFGKVTPALALDAIANDLVLAPTAYRNSKMKAFEKSPQGPEPAFGTEAEATFFKGQGGIHAKNAAAWARANLSPEAVAFMDQKIALYTKENERGENASANLQTQQNIRKATEEQVKTENKPKKKSNVQDVVGDPDYEFEADADFAAVHSQAHPVVLYQLENNNLSGALQALADSGSSKTAELFAENLSKLVGDVNLVYGAEKSMYDPATNTIYLRDGATEYEILHESSHATMSHTLDNPSHPVTRQVTNIFNQMKQGTEGTYGAQNIQEFAAEAWSNDAFRNRLKEFKPTGEKLTGWERLVNAVRQLLRLSPKTGTALDAVDRMLNDIISPPPETRTGETLYAQSLNNPNIAQEILTKVGNIARSYPIMNSERAVGFWKAAGTIGATGRQLMYKALNLSALGDVGSKYLGNSATRFASTIEEMAGYQEKLLEAMNPLHNRLAKFRQNPEYQTWSTLVNDSTRVDVNPEAELEKYKGSPEKEADWKQLNARFIKLTPEGKKLYHDLFATYKELDGEFLKSLERNINSMVGDKAQAASAYQKILFELSTIRVDHYAPLFREGTFWMQYDINGENKKETFESEAERDFARKQLEAKGATNVDVYSRADQLTTDTVPSGTMLADIMKIMKDNQAGDKAIDDLIQLVVKAMPEASILKSRQKRTGIGGYIDNAAFVFDRVSSNTSRQLARMQYGPELQRIMGEMQKTVNAARGDVNTYGVELIKEFEGRRGFAMKPTISSLAQFASSSAFYYNLAGNVSSAVINTLQTPLVVFPQLGGEYGFKDSYAALKNAMKFYTSSGYSRDITELTGEVSNQKAMLSIENSVNNGKAPQYAGLIGAMKDRGLLTTSTARDALSSENDNTSSYGSTNKLARQTALVGSFMFHHAERMNREITAVAAYDLEMGKLKNSNLSEAEKQAKAIDKALALVEYSHGAGSTLSGPSLGQSDVGKVLMVFKRFAFSMYYMLFDTMMRSLPVKGATGEQLEGIKAARRQLTGIYGMSALFAGAKGLPLYWVAELAYNMFQNKDDDDFDTVMRGFLGDLPFKGPVNYLTNLSIADRVGWTDLLWREQKGSKADASAVAQFLETLGGAPVSIIDSVLRGKDLIAEGQYERGIEAVLPIGLRNVLKGYRYATEGANTLRGDTVGEVNGANAAMQVLGFAPADLMKQYEENAYMTEKGKAINDIKKNSLKKYYAAMREGDSDGMMEARENLFELGAKYPDLKISENTISQSVKARDRISKEMHHGVSLDRKLAPYLRQAAAESYGD